MLDINNIFLFVFIFSLLGVVRVLAKTIVSLFRTPPTKVEFTNLETIVFGLFMSYIITYLLN
jgi:hypothetical protein